MNFCKLSFLACLSLFSVHHSPFFFSFPFSCSLFSIPRCLFSLPRSLFTFLCSRFSNFSSRFSVHYSLSTDPYSLVFFLFLFCFVLFCFVFFLFPMVKGNKARLTDRQTSPSSAGVRLHCWTSFAVLSKPHARHLHPFVRENETGFIFILRLLDIFYMLVDF